MSLLVLSEGIVFTGSKQDPLLKYKPPKCHFFGLFSRFNDRHPSCVAAVVLQIDL